MTDNPRIPEYYRHLLEQKPKAPERPAEAPAGKPETPEPPPAARPSPPAAKRPSPPAAAPAAPGPPPAVAVRPYEADAFALALPVEGWTDQTLYTLMGPVADGVQHHVNVSMATDVPDVSLADYAELQRETIEGQLQGCHVLLEDQVALDDGTPAARLVYRWEPTEGRRVYQHQLFVLAHGTAYTLSATFSKKSRETHGPEVERVMRSFQPRPPRHG